MAGRTMTDRERRRVARRKPLMSADRSESMLAAQARAFVGDLFEPNPLIYWTDLVVTLSIAYGCAIAFFLAPLFSPQQVICFIVSGFALHRLGNFIHEISHLRAKRSLASFRVAWNVLVGIPTLMPSYFFDAHLAHHNARQFGTEADCEYIALGRGPLRNIAWFMLQLFLQPIFVVTRFTILTPISFVHPSARKWVLENFSSFVFVWPCRREIPPNAPRAAWAAMDIACWLRATAIFVAVALGTNPWYRIPQLYMLAIFPLFLHYLRSLTAHNYLSDGSRLGFLDQVLDSIDITGDRVFTELLYPIGLRYHALHHLFPTMPYHNLAAAHRRLMEHLPADSPYRHVVYPSFLSVIRELIRNSKARAASA